MTDMTTERATALRKPFPRESVGKLPKSTCRDCAQSQRKRCDRHPWVTNCPECHGSHTSATLHLDYVGHAATTERLLTVDPTWTWEPFALGPDGLPALDRSNNLWIRLTVCGVTRIGVGDGKSAKECIGDAIRNAAMRFGVALDLWAKEDLVEFAQAIQTAPRTDPPPPPAADASPTEPQPAETPAAAEPGITQPQMKKIAAAMRDAGITDRGNALLYVTDVVGRQIESRADLTRDEAGKVIESLEADLAGKAGTR